GPADPHVGPRLRPDDAVDRPLARARPADRPPRRRRQWRHRRTARRLVLGRRRDLRRVAERHARPGAARRADRRLMRAVDLIERKRDGAEHTPDEIAWLVEGFTAGRVAAEQMSAWCMAVVFRGLSDAETDALCDAMIRSGETIDLSRLGRRVVDKHSTGG